MKTFKATMLAVSLFTLLLGGLELFNRAWGSGHLLGHLSAKWTLALGLYFILAAVLFVILYGLYFPSRLVGARKNLLSWREKMGALRWPLAFICMVFPAYFVFYSPWGGLFNGFFTRLLMFSLFLAAASFLISSQKERLVTWRSFLLAGLFIGSLLALAESFVLVSNYPFGLHWSEGNRLWDFSVLFGRARYNYPADQPIFAWIDPGRQALWGLPFIFPSLPIWAERLWGAFLTTIPYALLGWFAFKPLREARGQWLVSGLWALVFLNQGPIYTPLVLSSILVAFSRRKPIWIALPLVFLAGHYAGSSRFTWSFAPSIWAVMLTLSDGVLLRNRLIASDWLRAALLALAGMWTKGLPILLGVGRGLLPISTTATPVATGVPGAQNVQTLQGLQATASSQPFAWYRLLPNEIYPPGILLGLALATLPLILLLIYLARRGVWKTVAWQRVVLVGGLLVFLVVGVVASAKVGGGGDLHNLDMFLISLVLLAAVAWESSFYKHLSKFLLKDRVVQLALVAMILIPALTPMVAGKPLLLPSKERTEFTLARIQEIVACARQHGQVLFMDQRQLLTFGQMGDLPLVVDYEKKFVMDQALAGNEVYFAQFDADLAASRFSLIVGEREGALYKEFDRESIGDRLVEENNAWVTWVTKPLLRYYESVGAFEDAATELFVPKERNFDCR